MSDLQEARPVELPGGKDEAFIFKFGFGARGHEGPLLKMSSAEHGLSAAESPRMLTVYHYGNDCDVTHRADDI